MNSNPINRHVPDDRLESVSFALTCASTTSLVGKRFKIAVSLNNVNLDNQPAALGDQAAYFSAILPLQIGNATTAAPAGVDITGQQVVMTGADGNDPSQAVVQKVIAIVEFSGAAAPFTSIPLVVKGFFRNVKSPVHFDIAPLTGDVSPAITVADANGNNVPVNITNLPNNTA